MDLHMGEDLYESFVRYQRWLFAEFDKMVEVYGFQLVDAAGRWRMFSMTCVTESMPWSRATATKQRLGGLGWNYSVSGFQLRPIFEESIPQRQRKVD